MLRRALGRGLLRVKCINRVDKTSIFVTKTANSLRCGRSGGVGVVLQVTHAEQQNVRIAKRVAASASDQLRQRHVRGVESCATHGVVLQQVRRDVLDRVRGPETEHEDDRCEQLLTTEARRCSGRAICADPLTYTLTPTAPREYMQWQRASKDAGARDRETHLSLTKAERACSSSGTTVWSRYCRMGSA